MKTGIPTIDLLFGVIKNKEKTAWTSSRFAFLGKSFYKNIRQKKDDWKNFYFLCLSPF